MAASFMVYLFQLTGISKIRPRFRGQWLLSGFARLTRVPNLIILAITQYLTAIFLTDAHASWKAYLLDWRLLLLSLSTIAIAAAGYIINDYYDIKIDLINKPEKVVVGKVLKRRVVMAAHIALNAAGIGVGVLLWWVLGFIHFAAAFLLWFYSNRLKRLPLIGNLTIALLSGLAVFVVSILYRDHRLLIDVYALFAFAISLIREIIKDMEDVEGDALFGCRTLPIIWGIRKTKNLLYGLIAFFIFLLFFLAGMIGNQILIYYFILLSLPFTFFTLRLVQADTRREYAFLSDFCKLLMLSGILSMVFFG